MRKSQQNSGTPVPLPKAFTQPCIREPKRSRWPSLSLQRRHCSVPGWKKGFGHKKPQLSQACLEPRLKKHSCGEPQDGQWMLLSLFGLSWLQEMEGENCDPVSKTSISGIPSCGLEWKPVGYFTTPGLMQVKGRVVPQSLRSHPSRTRISLLIMPPWSFVLVLFFFFDP